MVSDTVDPIIIQQPKQVPTYTNGYCVLVVFLIFTLLLTFVGLNRSELEKNQAEDSHSTATSNMLIMDLTKQVRDLEESLSHKVMQWFKTSAPDWSPECLTTYRDLVLNNHNMTVHSLLVSVVIIQTSKFRRCG